MPYEIETKDGIVIRGIPDHIKPDDPTVKAKVTNARQASGMSNASAADKAMADPTAGNSFAQNALAGAGKGFTDAARGIGQIIGVTPQASIDEAKRLDAPLLNTGGGMTGNIGANIAMTALPGGAATTVPRAAGLGAALGGIQPVASDESRIQNIGLGAAGQTLANTVGRFVKPVQSKLNAPLQDLADKAGEYGINLTAAQKTGSKPLKILDAVFENLPFTADAQAAIKDQQRRQFTAAALKTVGESADQATPDVMNAARTRIGSQFTELSKRNSVNLADDFLNKIADVDATRNAFTKPAVSDAIEKALDLASEKTISGQTYQKVRSTLGKQSSDAFKSGNSELGQALKSIKTALDDAATGSVSQADKEAWGVARQQYQALKVLEKAAAPSSADAVAGNVSAAKLAQALLQTDRKGFTYGTRGDDISNLARIGQAFVKDQIPDSGTAQRALYQRILSSPLEAIGGAVGGFSVPLQKFINSPTGQKYLSHGAAQLTDKQKMIAEALRRGAVGAGATLPLAYTQ
jgi:hypothetical protein